MNLTSLLELPFAELVCRADKVRRRYAGKKIELCSIVNAKSGLCSEDCRFCAQSRHYRTAVSTYPLGSRSRILMAARRAKQIGAERFGIVTSGRGISSRELDIIAQAIEEIRDKVGIKLCASLGILDKKRLKALKKAGLERYHHNLESSERFYPQVASTHKFAERLCTVLAAKEAGLEVCSGGIIGMGESWQDRIELALLLKKLAVDSVPVNLLLPIPGTPLASLEPIACADAVRTIAIYRIILKDRTIKIAAGREAVLGDFQALGFMAGANGMLIGGYLSIKGREAAKDHHLVKQVKRLWTE